MKPWHAFSIEDTQKILNEGPKNYGPNRLAEKKTACWYQMLARQFNSFLVLILIIAAGLSFFLGDLIDTLAILGIIILNAVLGLVQEWKAENALKHLKKMLLPRCQVIRNGVEQEIDAEKLVPGDLVLLKTGNAVPADLRLINVINLRADESTLTGESVAVSKHTDPLPQDTLIADRRNMAWMGTHIVNGYGQGLVVATAMDTEFGKIAGLTSSIKETETNLQKQLAGLARQLGGLALLVSAAVALIGWLSGKDVLEMLMTGISLAVAAVPEGLPAVVTITLALGMGIMARKKALLRHLQAAETLGATSVICTDKTGTLTKNEMTVQKIWLASGEIAVAGIGYDPSGEFLKQEQRIEPQAFPDLIAFLDTGRKCNHARIEKTDQEWRALGSPTEASLIVAAEKAGLRQDHQACIAVEHSFNSVRKRMSVIEEIDDSFTVHVKGAPETVVPVCTHLLINGKIIEMDEKWRMGIEKSYRDFACYGLRTLALARKILPKGNPKLDEKNAETNLVFLGIAGIIDPPRTEVPEALTKAHSAGIRVMMMTGDSPDTALTIARQIGLKVDRAITSAEIKDMTDQELAALLKDDILFARTVPEDKFRLVKILQNQNQLVAMTGDGVNDAPALKQADIGIAMGIRGTDVARSAADMVLSDDNFASIIAAVEEGRRQYANIGKFVRYLTSHNIGEVTAIFVNILLGGPLLLLPIQILWLNLVTDSVTALSLSIEKAEKNIMHEPPRRPDQPILNKKTLMGLGLYGLYMGLATLGLFHVHLDQSYVLANTTAFTFIVVVAFIHVFNFRNLHGPISAIGWVSNPWLLMSCVAMLGFQLAAVYVPALQNILHTTPLSIREWIMIAVTALPVFALTEIYKIFRKRNP